jgi:hypothetical protein
MPRAKVELPTERAAELRAAVLLESMVGTQAVAARLALAGLVKMAKLEGFSVQVISESSGLSIKRIRTLLKDGG